MSTVRALHPPAVVGPGEARHIIAKRSPRGTLGRPAFAKHIARPDFPPATHLATGPVWEKRAVDAYARQRYTRKPYLDALAMFREHTAGGFTVHGACAIVGADLKISATTVRRYLQQLGEIPR